VLQLKPELRVIFMSGSAEEEIRPLGAAFLPKPFTPATLARVVREEIDRSAQAGTKEHGMNFRLD
jgi:hypothetical protein